MTVERPPERLICNFRSSMVGSDTVRTLLENGFSLVICCKDCPHIVEWTPPEIERRFGAIPQLKIADLVPRLSCSGPKGCGAKEVAVFPQLYEGEWKWPRRLGGAQ